LPINQFIIQNSATVDWLLQSEYPSVRYRTLIDLIGRTLIDPVVKEAREAIQRDTYVVELLSHQLPDGSWRGPRGNLWEEKGTVFSLLILGELGVNGSPDTLKALNYLHEHYQTPNGRLTYNVIKEKTRGKTSSTWMWCITVVILRAALLLGHNEHPLVKAAIDFFVASHEEKGGWKCSAYSGDPSKVKPPNCYMGSIKALSAFSLIPSNRRSKKIQAIIDQEVETCLENHVHYYRVDSKGKPAIKRAWLKFAFPRYWRSDSLEATDVLTGLGVRDKRIHEALELIRSKRQKDGYWLLDFSETKRAWIQIEQEGAPSKWVTLRALRTLLNSET
jgi:hypothetical protein